MQNAIILHGRPGKQEYYDIQYPSASNSHWVPWLQKQLLVNDVAAATPEMPDSYLPNYQVWQQEFERYDITPETILVGHSCGAGFLLRWLSEHSDTRVSKVLLVAPWLDPERTLETSFFDFTLDEGLLTRTDGITIFFSTDDEADISESVHQLRKRLPGIDYKEFESHGHFCFSDMNSNAFPELLAACLN